MSERAKQSTATNRKQINLALQGGGSHGAFTWGVLDRLLEDEEIELEAISGTSAGAMNAAVVTSGFARANMTGRERILSGSGRRFPRPRGSARFSDPRLMFCLATGRLAIRRCISGWICRPKCFRPMI